MEEFLHFLQGEMEKPGILSWFHLIGFVLVVAATFLVSFFFHDTKEKIYKRILFITWISLIVLEVFKQLIKAFHYGNPSTWSLSIIDFPFNICSMVYYFLPIIIFVNRERFPRIVDAAIGYMCLLSLFAGVAVCVYTDMVMSNLIYTNVQSLIHHGAQVVIGVYIYVWNRRNVTVKTCHRSLIAFAITAVIAIIINVSFYPNFINMFFINPLNLTPIPFAKVIQEKAGFVVYFLGYLVAIVAITYLVYLIETSIYKVTLKKRKTT